ncbi:MAG: glycosyltransferase family 39 protein [Armatimonadota bacterium]
MATSNVKSSVQFQQPAVEKASTARVWLTALVLTLAAAVFRLYRLGDWSFWVDEMFTLRDISGNGGLGLYHGMTYPLSYFLIGLSVEHYGVSEWSMRIIPAIVGMATPAMVYLLGRKSFGELPSAIASAIIVISPWHLYWSQMARFYTMTLFFSSASILMLHRGIEDNKRGYVAAAGILMALGTASHYSALLIIAAILVYAGLIYLLRWQHPRGLNLVNAVIFLAPFIIGGIFFLPKAVSLFSKYAAGLPTGTHIANPVKAAGYMVFSIGYRLEPLVAVLAIAGACMGIVRRDRGTLALTCVIAVPALFLIAAGIMSHAENRYAFVILPAAAILAGTAASTMIKIVREKSRLLAFAIPIIIALPLLQHDMSYFTVSNGERWNYRAAADYLRAHISKGETVYSSMWMPLAYYLKDTDLVVQDLNAGTDASGLPSSRSWLVMEDATRGESISRQLSGWIDANCSLKAHFSASSPATDYGISVYQRIIDHPSD